MYVKRALHMPTKCNRDLKLNHAIVLVFVWSILDGQFILLGFGISTDTTKALQVTEAHAIGFL